MKHTFLYTKSRNTVGYLDAHESLENSLWFMSDEYSDLVERFSQCSINQYLIMLVEIFRTGDPDYSRLGEILGQDANFEKNLFVINKVNRESEDIKRLAFTIINDYRITSLHLQLQKPKFLFDSLQNELINQKDVSVFEKNETVTIDVNNVTLIVEPA